MQLPTFTSVKESVSQYMFFRFLYDIANVVTWSYYIILLLRASNNSVAVVFLNAGGYNTGVMLGFFISSYFLSKIGYKGSYRLSNFLLLLCCIVTLVTLPQILEFHIILAVLRGISKSFFFAPSNMYNLKEVHGSNRSWLLNTVLSVDYIIGIVLPVIVGGSIMAYGYNWIFIVGILLYSIGIVYSWGRNKIPNDTLDLRELKPLFRKRGFKRWTALVIASEFMGELQVDALAIIPFLFLGNELNVGLFASALGFVAAFTAFSHRKDKFKAKLHMGYLGAMIIGAANLMFALVWTLPFLIIRGLIVTLGAAFFDPPAQEIGFRNKELVLGNFLGKSAVEIDLYLEVIYYTARITVAVMIGLIILNLKWDPSKVLQAIMLFTAFNGILMLYLNNWMNKLLSRKDSTISLQPAPLVAEPLGANRI